MEPKIVNYIRILLPIIWNRNLISSFPHDFLIVQHEACNSEFYNRASLKPFSKSRFLLFLFSFFLVRYGYWVYNVPKFVWFEVLQSPFWITICETSFSEIFICIRRLSKPLSSTKVTVIISNSQSFFNFI